MDIALVVTTTLRTILGSDADEVLHGSPNSDVLDGQAGNDTMVGGFGHDTYIVDSAGDQVIEEFNDIFNDYDMVQSYVSYALPDNVEELHLLGPGAIDGTGNALSNGLLGNDASNVLDGGDGDDYLEGRGGADTLIGGAGDDRYGGADGTDVIVENDATAGNTDSATLGDALPDQHWFRRVGDDLEVSQIGTLNKFIVKDWYLGSQHYVEEFYSNRVLYSTRIEPLVQAMAAFEPPSLGQTVLPEAYASVLLPAIATAWQLDVDNTVPTPAQPLADQAVAQGSAFSYTVPYIAFTDPDPWAWYWLGASLADGRALPAWLNFDSETRTFSGTPAAGDAGVLRVMVRAADGFGGVAFSVFTLTVQEEE